MGLGEVADKKLAEQQDDEGEGLRRKGEYQWLLAKRRSRTGKQWHD
jgi:hypothetical protein